MTTRVLGRRMRLHLPGGGFLRFVLAVLRGRFLGYRVEGLGDAILFPDVTTAEAAADALLQAQPDARALALVQRALVQMPRPIGAPAYHAVNICASAAPNRRPPRRVIIGK